MLIAGMNDLREAIAYAQAAESDWPASMTMPDGQFVMTYDSRETPPDNEVLGPITPRGPAAGAAGRRVIDGELDAHHAIADLA